MNGYSRKTIEKNVISEIVKDKIMKEKSFVESIEKIKQKLEDELTPQRIKKILSDKNSDEYKIMEYGYCCGELDISVDQYLMFLERLEYLCKEDDNEKEQMELSNKGDEISKMITIPIDKRIHPLIKKFWVMKNIEEINKFIYTDDEDEIIRKLNNSFTIWYKGDEEKWLDMYNKNRFRDRKPS